MNDTGERVRIRLGELAKVLGINTEILLMRWAVERFLCRLSLSPHREQFALKGAFLFTVWEGDLLRATSDLDLHGLILEEHAANIAILDEIARSSSDSPDGVEYGVIASGTKVLRGSRVPGIRVPIRANVGNARIHFQVSVGFGHAITPGPEGRWYPSLIPLFRAIPIVCYPRETVIAEKIATAVEFGADNTRLRDYYDIWHIASRYWFQAHSLTTAIKATFDRRDAGAFLRRDDGYWEAAFSASFATPARRNKWANWLKSHPPSITPPALDVVVEDLADFVLPILFAVRDQGRLPGRWDPRRGWSRQPRKVPGNLIPSNTTSMAHHHNNKHPLFRVVQTISNCDVD